MVKVLALAKIFRMGSRHGTWCQEVRGWELQPGSLGVRPGVAWNYLRDSANPWAWLSHVPTSQMDSLTPGSRTAGSPCGPGTRASRLLGHQGEDRRGEEPAASSVALLLALTSAGCCLSARRGTSAPWWRRLVCPTAGWEHPSSSLGNPTGQGCCTLGAWAPRRGLIQALRALRRASGPCLLSRRWTSPPVMRGGGTRHSHSHGVHAKGWLYCWLGQLHCRDRSRG